jgi:hypothetical protein
MGNMSKFVIATVLAAVFITGISLVFNEILSPYGMSYVGVDVSEDIATMNNASSNFVAQLKPDNLFINPSSFIATVVLTPLSLLWQFFDIFTSITNGILDQLAGAGFATPFISTLVTAMGMIVGIKYFAVPIINAVFKTDV